MTRLARSSVRRDLPPRPSGFLLLALSLAGLSGPARAATHYQCLKSFGSAEGMGDSPQAPLILGSDGAFYGSNYLGGTGQVGTVFKIGQDGAGYRVLHQFASGTNDGFYPSSGLLEASDGWLYGTTPAGGSNGGGTVFSLAKDGTAFSVLYHFGSVGTDGQESRAPLARGRDGAFYGTTYAGGDLGLGTLFRLFPSQTPDILSLGHTAPTAQIDFAGTIGFQYQVQRSTDLLTWSVVDSITMPSSGTYSVLDTQTPGSRAFYRAVWLPSTPSPRNAFEPMQTPHRNTNLKSNQR